MRCGSRCSPILPLRYGVGSQPRVLRRRCDRKVARMLTCSRTKYSAFAGYRSPSRDDGSGDPAEFAHACHERSRRCAKATAEGKNSSESMLIFHITPDARRHGEVSLKDARRETCLPKVPTAVYRPVSQSRSGHRSRTGAACETPTGQAVLADSLMRFPGKCTSGHFLSHWGCSETPRPPNIGGR
jgi:hypothetical protein